MSDPGALPSRSRILEHVWDFAYSGASNVVDQYVMYLCRKIDRPFRVEQLETLRGAGYRLREQPIQQARWPSGPERTGCR
jgi:two-component system OmpR family response regulator